MPTLICDFAGAYVPKYQSRLIERSKLPQSQNNQSLKPTSTIKH